MDGQDHTSPLKEKLKIKKPPKESSTPKGQLFTICTNKNFVQDIAADHLDKPLCSDIQILLSKFSNHIEAPTSLPPPRDIQH